MFGKFCPWGTLGLIMDIILLIIGIILVVRVTRWAVKKGYVGEKYCIALLAAIVFGVYACASYDVKKLKCNCETPSIIKESESKQNNK